MSTIMEQMPVVFQALNVGFVQTLKLFFVTLLGAFPLGSIIFRAWYLVRQSGVVAKMEDS